MTKICILAGDEEEAYKWARSQNLDRDQYFYPHNVGELLFKSNFHVIVVGTAGLNFPNALFENIYKVALERGKVGRY
jgi:hypothetical protein